MQTGRKRLFGGKGIRSDLGVRASGGIGRSGKLWGTMEGMENGDASYAAGAFRNPGDKKNRAPVPDRETADVPQGRRTDYHSHRRGKRRRTGSQMDY